ncbi:MAG: hypothetical protein ACPGUD_10530 [Parashewanella sp.]
MAIAGFHETLPYLPKCAPEIGDKIALAPRDAEFFISVMEKEGHSFWCAGYSVNSLNVLLARFGKWIDSEGVEFYIGMAFSKFHQLSGFIMQEGLRLHGHIRYEAYAISADQYDTFVSFMSRLVFKSCKEVKQGCFFREHDAFVFRQLQQQWAGNTEPQVVYSKQAQQENSLIESASYASFTNTCRSTASEVVALVTNNVAKVSKKPYVRLCSATEFDRDIMQSELLILPILVEQGIDENHTQILRNIYKKLIELRRSPSGVNKFFAFKRLYIELSDMKDKADILAAIIRFSGENRALITAHRSGSILSEPHSSRLVDLFMQLAEESDENHGFEIVGEQLSSDPI